MFRVHLREEVVEIRSCDICGGSVDINECYLLTTKQVVKSPLYWQNYYNMHKPRFSQLGITSYKDLLSQTLIRANFGIKLYQSPSPWLVCRDCISMFTVDRNECFSYVREWLASNGKFVPPGSGPAKLEDVNMGDGHVLYRGSEYVSTKVVDTVVCSICGHALKYVGSPVAGGQADGSISFDISFNAWELWVGVVCMTCGVVFCSMCLEVRRSTPCPRCGTMTQPAGRLQLQKIGKICSTSR